MAAWSLEQAYDAFPQVEGEFSAALEESLEPRGPGLLFDLVAGFGLAPGTAVLDVGCGEGEHALALASRFGFAITGTDPVPRHIEIARAAAAGKGPVFELAAEADQGFDPQYFAGALGALTQITDAAFAEYGADSSTIAAMRQHFAQWRQQLLASKP